MAKWRTIPDFPQLPCIATGLGGEIGEVMAAECVNSNSSCKSGVSFDTWSDGQSKEAHKICISTAVISYITAHSLTVMVYGREKTPVA